MRLADQYSSLNKMELNDEPEPVCQSGVYDSDAEDWSDEECYDDPFGYCRQQQESGEGN